MGAERQRVIDGFNAEGSHQFLMLVSTRAGGLGLNLATADTIVLYDPEFNPFIEQQAQSRAHRMGQKREVAVYQLVTAGSVEERIVQKAKAKLAIERLVVAEGEEDVGGGGGGGGGGDGAGETKRADGTKKKQTAKEKAAEFYEVLLHGAKDVMCSAAIGGDDENAKNGKLTTAAAEPTDAEIERLLDRASLPEEIDGEDGGGYLGNVGNHVIAVGGDEKDGDANAEGGDEKKRAPGPGGDEMDLGDELTADMQLEMLLSERAARLDNAAAQEFGRGKRERRKAVNTNVVDWGGISNGMHGGASGAVLAHSSACHVCGGDDTDEAEGEILLRCVECTASAHASCVGLDAAPDGGEWRCGKAMSGVCVRIGKPLVVAGAMSNAYDVGAMNNEDDDDDIAEHPSDDDYDEKNKSDSESESEDDDDDFVKEPRKTPASAGDADAPARRGGPKGSKNKIAETAPTWDPRAEWARELQQQQQQHLAHQHHLHQQQIAAHQQQLQATYYHYTQQQAMTGAHALPYQQYVYVYQKQYPPPVAPPPPQMMYPHAMHPHPQPNMNMMMHPGKVPIPARGLPVHVPPQPASGFRKTPMPMMKKRRDERADAERRAHQEAVADAERRATLAGRGELGELAADDVSPITFTWAIDKARVISLKGDHDEKTARVIPDHGGGGGVRLAAFPRYMYHVLRAFVLDYEPDESRARLRAAVKTQADTARNFEVMHEKARAEIPSFEDALERATALRNARGSAEVIDVAALNDAQEQVDAAERLLTEKKAHAREFSESAAEISKKRKVVEDALRVYDEEKAAKVERGELTFHAAETYEIAAATFRAAIQKHLKREFVYETIALDVLKGCADANVVAGRVAWNARRAAATHARLFGMLHHGDLLPDQSLDALEKEKRVKEQEEKRARAMQRALAESARAKRAEHAAALAGESAPGVDGTFGFHRWRAALDDPSMFDDCLAPLPAWTPNTPEVKPDLLRTSPAPWTVIVRGPVESLRRICETKPDNAPVKFLEKMAAAACARIGLCVEQKAGCARVLFHDPGTPGEPLSFWFPLEAIGTLPSQVRSIQTHWTTHRPVSTFDRVSFHQLTDELFLTPSDEPPRPRVGRRRDRPTAVRHEAVQEPRGQVGQRHETRARMRWDAVGEPR